MKSFFATLFLILTITGCQNRSPDTFNLVHHIPKNTTIIIKVNKLSLLKSALLNNDFRGEIENTSFYKDLISTLENANYLNPEGEVLFCFNEIGKQNFEHTIITKYRKSVFLTDSLKGKKIDTIKYDGAEIRKITTKNNVFFTTIIDSIFIASSSQLLAENIVRQRNANNVTVDDTFYKLYKTSDPKKSAAIFIDNSKIKPIADLFLESNISAYIQEFADWTTAELSITPDAIACTGIAINTPSSSKTITLFNNTIPQENLTATVTPINASGLISFTFDDYTRLNANLMEYNNKNTKEGNTTKNDTIFNRINEVGLIFEDKSTSIIMHTLAIEYTKSILTNETKPVTEFRGVPIYQYPDPQLFTAAFFPLIKNTPVKFYAFTDNFVLFSNTTASLQNIIANYQNQTTLSYSEAFKDMTSGLNQNASITMIGLHPGFKTALQKNITEHYKKDIETINLKNYPYFAFQAIADRNFTHIAAMVKKPTVKNKGNTIAQLLSIILDADVASPPQFVINHRTKQKEILVQDTENTLYLISNTGKVLWKKKLDGKIQGHVQQVDLYKNGRLQLAFVTQRKLNIIDRNGNEVAPFPVTIADNISQPLAVFDYDRNKNYRFLVCHGKKLSMYDSRGNIVSGFTRTQIQSNVVSPPKHFRIGTKDYLTIPEENGKLHILHRNGNTRIDVNRKINFSANPIYVYNNNFTVTDKEGRLVQIDEKGGISVRNLNLDQNHSITTTAKMLVTLSDNVLTIKDKKVTLDFGAYTPPQIFRIKNKNYIALTDTQTNKVYMYDSNAVLLPNFPVYGMAAIDLDDIDNDNILEFTVQGDKNAILLYKIN